MSTELWGTAVGYEENIVPEVKWLARGPHAALNRRHPLCGDAGLRLCLPSDTTQDTVDKLDAESFGHAGTCAGQLAGTGRTLDAE
ncbi:MAG: hypothetical protein R2838_11810 [Caldilineaceae bacterium]